MIVLAGFFLVTGFWAFRKNLQVSSMSSLNGLSKGTMENSGKWQLPEWMRGEDSDEVLSSKREQSINNYRDEVHRALNPKHRR
jgi:hypothetical protein